MNLNDLTPPVNLKLGLSFPSAPEAFYPAISAGGMGICRLSVSWRDVNDNGWTGLEGRCAALRAEGIEPFLTFECNDPSKTSPLDHGITNQRPLNMNQWLSFVALGVQKTMADHYQFVNEWNSRENAAGGWLGTSQELINFVTDSASTVRANSNAQVVMGGITPGALDILVLNRGLANYEVCTRSGPGSLPVCYSASHYQNPVVDAEIDRIKGTLAGVGPHVDSLDLHLYGPADRDPVRIQAVKNEGWVKPFLSAECGGPSLHYGDYTGEAHFMAVMERNLNMLSSGLPFGLWFRLAEGPGASFGNSRTALAEQDGTPKPGYAAYKLLATALDGATGVSASGTQYTISHPVRDRLIAWGNGWMPIPPGDMWRVTDPVTGSYDVSTPPWNFAMLSQWPLVAGMG